MAEMKTKETDASVHAFLDAVAAAELRRDWRTVRIDSLLAALSPEAIGGRAQSAIPEEQRTVELENADVRVRIIFRQLGGTYPGNGQALELNAAQADVLLMCGSRAKKGTAPELVIILGVPATHVSRGREHLARTTRPPRIVEASSLPLPCRRAPAGPMRRQPPTRWG